MKRARIVLLVTLGAFALASCDAMLEVLFPEFQSDEGGEFLAPTKTITVTVLIGGHPDYHIAGGDTGFNIEVAAVSWNFFGGLTWVFAAGTGVDHACHNVFPGVGTPVIGAGSPTGSTSTYTIEVPEGNYGVFVFEDVNGDGEPSTGETIALAMWSVPPEFVHHHQGREEFDFNHLNSMDPPVNDIVADDTHIIHFDHGPGIFPDSGVAFEVSPFVDPLGCPF